MATLIGSSTGSGEFFAKVEKENHLGIWETSYKMRRPLSKALTLARNIQYAVYDNEGNRFFAKPRESITVSEESDFRQSTISKYTTGWGTATWRALGEFSGAMLRMVVALSDRGPRVGGFMNNVQVTEHHHHYGERSPRRGERRREEDNRRLSTGQCWAAAIAGVGLAWAMAKPFANELRAYLDLGKMQGELEEGRLRLQGAVGSLGNNDLADRIDQLMQSSIGIIQNERNDYFYGTILKTGLVVGAALLAGGGFTAHKRAAVIGLATCATSVFGMLFKSGFMRTGRDNRALAERPYVEWGILDSDLEGAKPPIASAPELGATDPYYAPLQDSQYSDLFSSPTDPLGPPNPYIQQTVHGSLLSAAPDHFTVTPSAPPKGIFDDE